MKASGILFCDLALGAALCLAGCNGGTTNPPAEEPPIEEVTRLVGPEGGTVSTGQYSIHIPEGAVNDTVTVTLGPVSGNPETSLDIEVVEHPPLTFTISGASVTDTLYLCLPESGAPRNSAVIAIERSGEWRPLPRLGSSAGRDSIAVSPDLFAQHPARSVDSVGGNIFQLRYSVVPTLVRRMSAPHAGPAILLIHGICSDYTTWTSQLTDSLVATVGEVWSVDYDWKRSFLDVRAEVVEQIQTKIGSRSIYILAHSKGGLLARSIIRNMEADGIAIEKSVFFGTPHDGVSERTLQLGAGLPTQLGLCDRVLANPEWDGYRELKRGSSELGALATEVSFTHSARPSYLCVVGSSFQQVALDCLLEGSDWIVCRSSADLTGPLHAGRRELASYAQTHDVVLGGEHTNLHHPEEESWTIIRSFLTSAQLTDVSCVLTYDNFYGIYWGDAATTSVTLIGRDEGTDEWHVPEQWTFQVSSGGYIYVFGWNAFLETGLLGDVLIDGVNFPTGLGWEVALPPLAGYGQSSAVPSSQEMLDIVQSLNASASWGAVFGDKANGQQPWAFISEISSEARWISLDRYRRDQKPLVFRFRID